MFPLHPQFHMGENWRDSGHPLMTQYYSNPYTPFWFVNWIELAIELGISYHWRIKFPQDVEFPSQLWRNAFFNLFCVKMPFSNLGQVWPCWFKEIQSNQKMTTDNHDDHHRFSASWNSIKKKRVNVFFTRLLLLGRRAVLWKPNTRLHTSYKHWSLFYHFLGKCNAIEVMWFRIFFDHCLYDFHSILSCATKHKIRDAGIYELHLKNTWKQRWI